MPNYPGMTDAGAFLTDDHAQDIREAGRAGRAVRLALPGLPMCLPSLLDELGE